jgi:prevent-host-death family protein
MLPVHEAQQNLSGLIDTVNQSHQPIVITGEHTNAVLLSESDWTAIQETLYLLSVPGMRESLKAGMDASLSDCAEELDW